MFIIFLIKKIVRVFHWKNRILNINSFSFLLLQFYKQTDYSDAIFEFTFDIHTNDAKRHLVNIRSILLSVNQSFKMMKCSRNEAYTKQQRIAWKSHVVTLPAYLDNGYVRRILISTLRNALNIFTLRSCNGHAIRILIHSSILPFATLFTWKSQRWI